MTAEAVRAEGIYRALRGRFMTAQALLNTPDLAWLVDSLIPQRSFAVLFGDSGAFKSFAALDLALSVALGRDWCGRRVERGAVVYLWGEGASGLKPRLEAWEHAHGTLPNASVFSHEVYGFSDAQEVDAFVQDLGFLPEPPVLIVVDTLAEYFGARSDAAHAPDEDNTKDMRQFTNSMKRIRNQTGATVLVIHHTNASGRLRGNKLLRAAADCVLEAKKKRGTVEIRTNKMRDGAEIDGVSLIPRRISLGLDEQGRERDSLVLEAGGNGTTVGTNNDGTWRAELLPVHRQIEMAVQQLGGPSSVSQIAAHMNSKVNTVRPYVYELADWGQLHELPRSRSNAPRMFRSP